MPRIFGTSDHNCECIEFGADNGKLTVTIFGDFPACDGMSLDEVSSILNDPVFADLLQPGRRTAEVGTPLFDAFERLRRGDTTTAILKFEQSEHEVAA